MKLSVIKSGGVLHPAGEQAIEDFKHLENGMEFVINVTVNRNPKFHRLAFSLFKTIFDNQEFFTDFDVFRKYLIMKSGRVQIIETPKGTLFLPESVAFEKMTQYDFEKLFQAVITFAVKEYGQDENILNQILNYA